MRLIKLDFHLDEKMSFRDRIKGRYAIEAKLGAGSFGEVYTCWDTKKSRNDDDIKVIKVRLNSAKSR